MRPLAVTAATVWGLRVDSDAYDELTRRTQASMAVPAEKSKSGGG
eukprot:CAMPEP_0113243172 /NCGR_PEP_ID=MMETSP0008_2-20120614/7724_1 /TAXON_ID=97485 /ORGANISM="Prymnesium parvum" /LENGTH=44 /DNA_ID=CAMNT_0000090701 /DNA_START=820 /DNA_END=954 /DNA_ORIENTATION=- /assembly_acc=CAM_ASM_000153